MNICEWMIENKYAKNTFNASAIANGLRLAGLPYDEQLKRVKAYRAWRDAGECSAVCFAYVLSGKEPPAELFPVAESE